MNSNLTSDPNSPFKQILPSSIRKVDPNQILSNPDPTSDPNPPEILTKAKKDKLYRIYYNLKQRADNRLINFPFIDVQDFYDFAMQSGYKINQRIKRIPDGKPFDRSTIQFVDVQEIGSGRKNNKYIRKKNREKKKKDKSKGYVIPESFPD